MSLQSLALPLDLGINESLSEALRGWAPPRLPWKSLKYLISKLVAHISLLVHQEQKAQVVWLKVASAQSFVVSWCSWKERSPEQAEVGRTTLLLYLDAQSAVMSSVAEWNDGQGL